MLRKAFVVAILGMVLVLAGCAVFAEDATTPATGGSASQEIGGLVELVDALRAAGATVDTREEVEQEFFSVPGQIIELNGTGVQVFEYADEASREAESAQISPDGSAIGTSMVTWVDQPNFWAKGRVIALYIGKDAGVIDLLNNVLGEPITLHTQ